MFPILPSMSTLLLIFKRIYWFWLIRSGSSIIHWLMDNSAFWVWIIQCLLSYQSSILTSGWQSCCCKFEHSDWDVSFIDILFYLLACFCISLSLTSISLLLLPPLLFLSLSPDILTNSSTKTRPNNNIPRPNKIFGILINDGYILETFWEIGFSANLMAPSLST